MIIKNQIQVNQIQKNGIVFNVFETGDIFDISYEDKQLNLVKGNMVDGSLLNLYLRVHQDNQISSTRLIGRHSPSTFKIVDNIGVYEGIFEQVAYQVKLIVEDFTWHFIISLTSNKNQKVDVIYGQDIAIQAKSSVLSSEPYTVQYIDYKAFYENDRYILCARQNQGASQFLQIGSHMKNIAYSTDGFQFFNLSYKETGIPQALYQEKLASEIYQYEFSYFALQSELIDLDHQVAQVGFYGYYEPEFKGVIEKPIVIASKTLPLASWVSKSYYYNPLLRVNEQLNGLSVDRKYIESQYKVIEHVEQNDQDLLSFFTSKHHHIVMKQKELLVERPHGHLMIHGDLLHVSENVMATTNFMFGLFNSHVVLGNTSFNKLLGDLRNPLNVQKISGQRIYIKRGHHYHILGLPSYYEMGATITKWVYVLEDDVITVSSFVHINKNQENLVISSKENKTYDIIITNQILMGVNEYQYDINYEVELNKLIFRAPKSSMMASKYPNINYQLESVEPFSILTEKEAFGLDGAQGLLILKYDATSKVEIITQASIEDDIKDFEPLTIDQADEMGTRYFESILWNLDIAHPIHGANLKQLIHLSFWYTHNALTHYASPHGLEQYNGAAWGTRDVCQGPIELFSSAQRFDIVREILLKVYKRQFKENGDFPQWYMFDKYYQIQAHESHGDIIVWPLRSLAFYLKATKDLSILEEQVPLMSLQTNDFSESISVIDHVRLQVNAIIESFIEGTSLPKYGGGDWDDTLQPANHELTHKMVSGWTVALLYETLKQFSTEIKDQYPSDAFKYLELAKKIKSDYEKYIIVDGIPAGFVVFNDEMTYLLHPRDEKTGLKYRLLPFTRAMISEIADPKQIVPYTDLIAKVFKHPDGVRLMDTTVLYQGGKKTYFHRAETAANFGREIGLQYVHAHIRYIEAMANIGYKNLAYKGLFEINPILIQKAVPNAMPRQSNVYFSSSDANFYNRYEAKKHFDLVKKGEIGVKGGWRLYSSGPGIYIKQLINNVLGFKIEHGDLVIDPMLPDKYDELILQYHYLDKPLTVKLHVGHQEPLFMGKPVSYERLDNPYRQGGIRIKKSILDQYQYLDLDVWVK